MHGNCLLLSYFSTDKYVANEPKLLDLLRNSIISLILSSFFVFGTGMQTTEGEIVHVEIGSPGLIGTINNLDLAYIGPAFDLALNDCNRLYSDTLNFSVTYLTVDGRDVEYSYSRAIADRMSVLLPQWYYTKRRISDSDAVIITGGGQESSMIHQLSAEWNILYLTTVAYRMSTYALSGPTPLVTAVISLETLAVTVLNLLELYDWTTIFRVVDLDSPVVYLSISNDIDVNVKKRNSALLQYQKSIHSRTSNPFPALLNEFRGISRVLLFLGRSEPLRRLLLIAASQNLTNGEFVYICVEPYQYVKQYGNYTWQYNDELDQAAREAFRSLLIVHPIGHESTKTMAELKQATDFGAFVRARAKEQYHISYNSIDQPLWDALSTYSTIKMYCQVINESLHSDGLNFLKDGRRLVNKFLNLTFRDEYSDIFIDSNGIRRTTLAVSHFSDISRGFRQAFLIQPPHNLQLQHLPGNSLNETWPGKLTWPPKNEPPCGYKNDSMLCQVTFDISQQPIFIGMFTASLFGVIAVTLLLRWYLYNHHLHEPWWTLYPEYFRTRKHSTQASCMSKALYPDTLAVANNPLKSTWITWNTF